MVWHPTAPSSRAGKIEMFSGQPRSFLSSCRRPSCRLPFCNTLKGEATTFRCTEWRGCWLAMITGVETAGLVLAIFPLLVSALEHYQEGFERLSDWWKFRTEFIGFVHVIGRQAILFDENLEELLSPLIISDAEMDALCAIPQALSGAVSNLRRGSGIACPSRTSPIKTQSMI